MPASASHTSHRRERSGVVLCALAAASFGATVVLTKLAYGEGANVVTLLAARFTLATLVLWPLALRKGVVRSIAPRDAAAALLLGLVVYSAETALIFTALTRLDASLVELLVFCYPALVVLGAIALRRERASARRIAALAVASTGVLLVLAGSSSGALEPVGTALALSGATLYAAYVLLTATLTGRLHPLALTALVCTGAAVAFTCAGITLGTLHLAMAPAAWGWIAVIGLGSTVIGLTAFLGGIERLGPSRASIIATLEPPVALVLAFLVFDERLAPLQIAGGVLVVTAVVILQARSIRSRDRGASACPSAAAPARALAHDAPDRRRVGVRAKMGRLPGARVRRRDRDRAPVARR